MVRAYKWMALNLCIFLSALSLTVEARVTVTPVGSACPGEDMTFTCQKTSSDGAAAALSNVRWTLMRDGVEVIPQLTLTQGSGCPYLYRHYNNQPIMVTLQNSYSTLNVTADSQLQGIMVECLLVTDTAAVERESVPVQIMQLPSSPSGLHTTTIHNRSYGATLKLAWDINQPNNDTYAVSVLSPNGESWLSTVRMEVGELPITLLYNMDYTLNVSATNCAGHSDVLSITDIFVANCSAPIITNPGVVVKPYNSTVEGTALYFKCDSGFLPNERRVAVCQSNGQWSIEISNITCEQDIRYEVNQTLLTVTEREPLWNCSIHGRVERLAGFIVASFVLGMICGVVFLSLPYLIKKRCEALKKKNIELSENMAYETIPPKSTHTPQR